jgi:CxxC motif-containing protein (DUF1111 family)
MRTVQVSFGSHSCCLAALALVAIGCGNDRDAATGEPGTPLPELGARELARFQAGRALFDKVFSPEEGLGPAFNENQCSACHTRPASGGSSGFERVVKATRFGTDCDALGVLGGPNVRTQATPQLRAYGIEHETIPTLATDTGHFAPPFLFGLGLIEAIPAATILTREDPGDSDGDGISGRAGRTLDSRIARFGRKAEFATIEDFSATALHLEMGLTNRRHPRDLINGKTAPASTDPVPDPEVSDETVTLLSTFVRFLAAPRPPPARSRAHADTVREGRRLFDALGCPACHTPTMRTGQNEIPALANRTVPLFSDLLLHDMGSTLADVCGPTATPFEVRTEPLMGLGSRDRFLHDARTDDITEAILDHGGEARKARDGFARLAWIRQQYLVIFLKSL